MGAGSVAAFIQEYLDRVVAYHQTNAYKKADQKRKVWVEPLFGEGQQWHGLRQLRLRGLWKVNCEGVLTATGQNLKRLLSWRGWGAPLLPRRSLWGRASTHEVFQWWLGSIF
jgi:hypothetical protein